MPESAAAKRARARAIMARLETAYPDATIALRFETPLQLLVATILAAQCTDERVNQVTPGLFAAYPTAADFAGARSGRRGSSGPRPGRSSGWRRPWSSATAARCHGRWER
jgi:hypothetical protein